MWNLALEQANYYRADRAHAENADSNASKAINARGQRVSGRGDVEHASVKRQALVIGMNRNQNPGLQGQELSKFALRVASGPCREAKC